MTRLVRCTRCGRQNRIVELSDRKGTFSCGHCRAPLRIPPTVQYQVIRFTLLCLAAIFAWASWPTSAWLGLTALAAYLLTRTGHSYVHRSNPTTIETVAAIILEKLGEAFLCVSVGVAIVCTAQIVLPFIGTMSPHSLAKIELLLSDARNHVHHLIGFEALLISLLTIVTLSMIMPKWNLLTQFSSLRTKVVSLYFVLLGLTSFTFFSMIAVENYEDIVISNLRAQFEPILSERNTLMRQIAGASWIEANIKEMDSDARQSVNQFFVRTARTPNPSAAINQLVSKLERSAPRLQSNQAGVPDSPIERAALHLTTNPQISHDSPTLREIKLAALNLEAELPRLRHLRAAAIEAVAEGVGNLLAGSNTPLVKAFIEELSGALARRALHGVLPSVQSLESARIWIQSNISAFDPKDIAPLSSKWVWNSAHFNPPPAPSADALPPHLRPGGLPPTVDPHLPRTPTDPYIPRPTFEPPKIPKIPFRP